MQDVDLVIVKNPAVTATNFTHLELNIQKHP